MMKDGCERRFKIKARVIIRSNFTEQKRKMRHNSSPALIMIFVVWCMHVCHVTDHEFEESWFEARSKEHDSCNLAIK